VDYAFILEVLRKSNCQTQLFNVLTRLSFLKQYRDGGEREICLDDAALKLSMFVGILNI
jgi:hypothetical protein